MIDLLFDQFQRYNNVASIINNLRQTGQIFNILEVGANEHQNLEKFLPEDQITYLDIQLPDKLQSNPKYLLGDATSMVFPDNKYNIVVALDVFEHIFPEDRVKFINEIYRVSSDFFVITAPFHSTKVVEAERRVNAVYKTIFNKNFIWLEEHMMNGLPDINNLTEYLYSQGINYKVISHGDIDIWEKMMTIHFIAAQDSRLGIYRNEIDRFYNQYIFNCDFVDESYRKICVAAKSDILSSLQPIKIDLSAKEQLLAKLNDLERKFYMIAGLNINNLTTISEDFVQIFLDFGEGYSENNSSKVEVGSGKQTVKMDYDCVSIKSFRIDPSNTKGTFEIKNINVRTLQQTIAKENFMISGNFNFVYEDKFVFCEDDPFIIVELLSEFPIEEISFDILKLTNEDVPLSIINYYSNQINEFALREAEVEKKISLIREENSHLAYLNEKISSEIDRYKISTEVMGNENKEMKRKNEELIQLNSIYMDELKSIHTSRSWIYLTKIKRVFGK